VTTYTHVTTVLDALVALFTSALPELAVNGGILDGPPTTNLPDDYAAVGYNPGTVARPQVAAVRGRQELSDYINDGVVETFEIFCQIATYSGDMGMSVPRSRTLTYFNELSGALAADRSLGGLVPLPGKAEVGDMQWYLEQGGDLGGTVVTVVFTITCRIEFMQ
jgi:hypothetical protein